MIKKIFTEFPQPLQRSFKDFFPAKKLSKKLVLEPSQFFIPARWLLARSRRDTHARVWSVQTSVTASGLMSKLHRRFHLKSETIRLKVQI